MLSIIIGETHDPARNLALDEALARTTARSAQERPHPVLRLWRTVPCVVVGRFQSVTATVDLAACAFDGVRVLRRASGGGAVYADAGTLNVTLVRAHGPGGGLPARPAGVDRSDLSDLDGFDLEALVTEAVTGLGLAPVALRDGIVKTAWLRTRRTTLAHATVQVATLGTGSRYLTVGGERRTLAGYGLGITLDAVRAAILGAAVDWYGAASARPPSAVERRCRDQLLTRRYSDVTWHLSGMAGHPASLGTTAN